MKRSTLFFILFLLLLATAVGYKQLSRDDASSPLLPKSALLLAFGDSLTYGTGAEADESYPARLEQRLGVRVINAGIPGELSAEGLKRLPSLLEKHRPSVVLLCHGGNDILKKSDNKALKANLEAMVRLIQERGSGVVLIGVPQFSLFLSPHPAYEDIASAYGIPLENQILSDVLGDAGTKSDQIHPNAAGYEKMAEAVEKVLRENYRLEE